MFEQEKFDERVQNDVVADTDVEAEGAPRRLSGAQLRAELAKIEKLLQAGNGDGVSDQWRIYQYIVEKLAADKPLRLMVQASAGTGKPIVASLSRCGRADDE